MIESTNKTERTEKNERIEKASQNLKGSIAAGTAALIIHPARAALPTTAPPTRSADDGNFIQLLQNYAYDIGIFAGLALALVVFFIVIKNTIVAYNDIPNGRSTMGAVAMQAGVGVLLMVFIMFLLTEAAGIL